MAKARRKKHRANYVPAPAYYNLNMACIIINDALSLERNGGCYLVGSSTERPDYRDVDVRFIMNDETYARLFPGAHLKAQHLHPLWSLVCSSISCWLQQQTGLPIDFQIQQQTTANEEYPNGGRHPLGMFLNPNPADYGNVKVEDD